MSKTRLTVVAVLTVASIVGWVSGFWILGIGAGALASLTSLNNEQYE